MRVLQRTQRVGLRTTVAEDYDRVIVAKGWRAGVELEGVPCAGVLPIPHRSQEVFTYKGGVPRGADPNDVNP